jgi:hypothetical protein
MMQVEKSPSGRAGCIKCKAKIALGSQRLVELNAYGEQRYICNACGKRMLFSLIGELADGEEFIIEGMDQQTVDGVVRWLRKMKLLREI